MSEQDLVVMIQDMVAACRSLDKFHREIFSYGRPLCIDGKPIDHTTLNDATAKAQSVLRRLEAR